LKEYRSDSKTGAAMQIHFKHSGCWIRPLHWSLSYFWDFSGKVAIPPHTLWTVRTGRNYVFWILDPGTENQTCKISQEVFAWST